MTRKRSIGAVGLLLRTYPFLLIRLGICIAAIYPGYLSVMWGIDVGRDLAGRSMLLVDIAFGYVGLTIFILYIELCRKLITHFVKYAQIACYSELLANGEIKGSSLIFGFREVGKRFGSVSAAYPADFLLTKSLKKVSKWIVDEGNFLPEFLKKGLLVNLVGSVVQMVITHSTQIVVSYLFVHEEESIWKGISKGLVNYAKAWKEVVKSAFVSLLVIKAFGWMVGFGVFVGVSMNIWNAGIHQVIVYLIFYKILTVLLKTMFLEPYLSAMMLIAYYKHVDKEIEDEITEQVESIASRFGSFLTRKNRDYEGLSEEISSLLTSKMGGQLDGVPVFNKVSEILDSRKRRSVSQGEEG